MLNKVSILLVVAMLLWTGYAMWDSYTRPPVIRFYAPWPPDPFWPVKWKMIMGNKIAIVEGQVEMRNIHFEGRPDGSLLVEGRCKEGQ